MCREFLGDDFDRKREDGSLERPYAVYFHTVPISLFTVFRMAFSDFSAANGTPLIESIRENSPFGGLHCVVYSLLTFFVTAGLFNIISAIFVEATICTP